MRHEELTQLDFERSPVWRLVDKWETVEPVKGSAWLEKPHDAFLVAIEVSMPNSLSVPGYAVIGELRDPSALFLWETPTKRMFLNGRPFPFEHVLQRLVDNYGANLRTLFPLAFQVLHFEPAFRGQFMPRGLGRS